MEEEEETEEKKEEKERVVRAHSLSFLFSLIVFGLGGREFPSPKSRASSASTRLLCVRCSEGSGRAIDG